MKKSRDSFLLKVRKSKRIIHYWGHLVKQRLTKPNAVYLVFTPEHGNLGDHAIALSEEEILTKEKIPYIEYTGKTIEYMYQNNMLSIMNGRPIIINGGGNMGTLWFDVEEATRAIIRCNPHSKILIMPNTLFYDDNEAGRKELENSVSIYNKHKNLTIYAREEHTYQIAKKIYRQVKKAPDMAMMLNYSQNDRDRDGCILCLRSDLEKTRTDEDDQLIIEQISALFGNKFSFRDMCVDYGIPPCKRKEEVEKQLDSFKRAELVITDRLHGMIFCAITGTPCIVVNSKSPKVEGCYEWLRHLSYIRFCKDVKMLSSLYEMMPKGSQVYDNAGIMSLFEEIRKDILQAVGNH